MCVQTAFFSTSAVWALSFFLVGCFLCPAPGSVWDIVYKHDVHNCVQTRPTQLCTKTKYIQRCLTPATLQLRCLHPARSLQAPVSWVPYHLESSGSSPGWSVGTERKCVQTWRTHLCTNTMRVQTWPTTLCTKTKCVHTAFSSSSSSISALPRRIFRLFGGVVCGYGKEVCTHMTYTFVYKHDASTNPTNTIL